MENLFMESIKIDLDSFLNAIYLFASLPDEVWLIQGCQMFKPFYG